MGAALRALREERRMTADDMARRLCCSRAKLSKLENGHLRPDLAEVMKILDFLEVTGQRWEEVVKLARDAAERGWWDGYGLAMGDRQRMYADIESGADSIREYNQFAIPGTLQTEDFMWEMVKLAEAERDIDFVPDRMVEARLRRQEQLLGQKGPRYEVILDEVVIRRPTVPPEVMIGQLRHLTETATRHPRVTVRVLPLVADFTGRLLPLSAFFLFTFPDPADPPMAIVDTVNTDIVHVDHDEVMRYTRRYEHLREIALSGAASLGLLIDAADDLEQRIGSSR
ncbi:helix-turn-helix domain-containing protein [Thermomonospora echinospora]|nr:helix-turn-helix transcriptional regulator [Thermomonospora echinospora]